MKRVLGIALALVSMGFVVSAEAKTANVSSEVTTVANIAPQYQWQRDRYGRRYDRRYDRRYNRRQRTFSRVVRYGRRLYRETYLVTYRSNGRYNTRLINRTRIG
ncbi:MAG TPA: hypothetical protein VJ656_12715 [Pyrinomonadaceae bacterium]|nr:hypothetical protein [Pyrinomonadaceae bacterium]